MRPLRVLFLKSDDLVAHVRLLPMLEMLRASGRIALTVADRDLGTSGDRCDAFDVCLAHRNLGKRQIGWLRGRRVPLLYDIDDLLTQGGARTVVRECLGRAAVVTAPSRRLLGMLAAETDRATTIESVYLPNAGRESPPPARRMDGPPSLIWISSAVPQAGDGMARVCEGIAAAAAKLNSEVLLVGRFSTAILQAFPSRQHVPWIAPDDLLDWLAARSLIAVAPLSTDLAPQAQAFADCKSDIKIAQYGACGIAGVYAPAPPYVESDLPRRIVASNDASGWEADILNAAQAYPGEGAALAAHAAFAARRPSVLAETLLAQLQRAAASGPPFVFRAIATPPIARLVERKVRSWLR